MQPVPDCQPAGPVRVDLVRRNGMVNAVQSRRHNEPGRAPLPSKWKAHIGVVEQNTEEQEYLPARNRGWIWPDDPDLRSSICNGQRYFAEMKTERS